VARACKPCIAALSAAAAAVALRFNVRARAQLLSPLAAAAVVPTAAGGAHRRGGSS
jgi:hypothetical protein